MSFRDYVAEREVTKTLVGEFLAEAKADHGFPDAATWTELDMHLRRRRASAEAFAAARVVWAGYRVSRWATKGG